MSDILDRIDSVLSEVKATEDLRYVPKENAEYILGIIIEEVEDDEVLLQTILEQVKRDWGAANVSLLENFYKILTYYGVFEEDGKRKTILETKGKTIIRKFVKLERREEILKLLK